MEVKVEARVVPAPGAPSTRTALGGSASRWRCRPGLEVPVPAAATALLLWLVLFLLPLSHLPANEGNLGICLQTRGISQGTSLLGCSPRGPGNCSGKDARLPGWLWRLEK